MSQPFAVIETSTGRHLDGLPTPLLIQTGSGEAWQEDRGIWRLRDDRHDPRGTEYTRVRVVRQYEYIVDLTVEVVDPSGDALDEYSSEPDHRSIHVEATSPREADDLARGRAADEAREWAGDVPLIITTIRVEEQS